MLGFEISDIKRIAAAAVGALVLTTISVGAAVAPARAVETAPIVYAADQTAHEARG